MEMNTIWTIMVIFTMLFTPIATLRVGLIIIGWVFVALLLLGDGIHRTPPLWRPFWNVETIRKQFRDKGYWAKYVEMAWRNPTNGMAGWIKQPIPEKKPNPDHNVRVKGWEADSRFMRSGWFWEYWYLRDANLKLPKWLGGRHYKWFEFRIGWKYVDGNDEFFPTFQLGFRSS